MRYPPRSGSVRIRYPPLPMPSVLSLLLLDWLLCQLTAGHTEAQGCSCSHDSAAGIMKSVTRRGCTALPPPGCSRKIQMELVK